MTILAPPWVARVRAFSYRSSSRAALSVSLPKSLLSSFTPFRVYILLPVLPVVLARLHHRSKRFLSLSAHYRFSFNARNTYMSGLWRQDVCFTDVTMLRVSRYETELESDDTLSVRYQWSTSRMISSTSEYPAGELTYMVMLITSKRFERRCTEKNRSQDSDKRYIRNILVSAVVV